MSACIVAAQVVMVPVALIVGAKLKIGGLLVLKGEYRRFDFSDDPLVPMDSRVSAGAGLSF